MRVFITGATGFIGSAVVQELINAGHQVLGLARSDAAAKALTTAGAQAHAGALDDADSLRRGAASADGVIHTAFVHDFSNMAAAAETDRRAIETLGAALAGSGRPMLVTSAIGLLAAGSVGTEQSLPAPGSAGAHRIASEAIALGFATQGVRASVVRLPPSVHGDGDRGFVPALIRIAREKGVSVYLDAGTNRWPAVHRLDAACLFRLALEKAAAGAVFHGVADSGVPTREIADVIGRGLNVPVVSKPSDQGASHFAWLARFFAVDLPASSQLTQERLGWLPRQPGLLSDIEHGRYFVS